MEKLLTPKLMLFLGLFLFQGEIGGAFPTKDLLRNLMLKRRGECGALSQQFLRLRDDLLEIAEWAPDGAQNIKGIEMALNFRLESDGHIKNLACDIADVESMEDLIELLTSMQIPYPVTELYVGMALMSIQETKAQVEAVYPAYESFLNDVSAWMRKTGYPDSWPLQNTNKQEIGLMLDNAVLLDMLGVFVFSETGIDHDMVTTAMLESNSLEEYAEATDALNFEFHKDDYLEILHVIKDDDKLQQLFGFYDDVIAVLDEIEKLGIFDLYDPNDLGYQYYQYQ